MSDWASESGHWYDSKTGEPRYRIVGANGVERATTLRDARTHGWVPSVTTITSCAARYQLERWKAEQLLLAGLTLPRIGGEDESHWIQRVWDDSREQAAKAAARGTEIHGAIEDWFSMPTAERLLSKTLNPWVQSVVNLIKQEFGPQQWHPEKSFASPLGYGGKVDLHSDSVLIDFKGKEAKNGVRDWRTYDEHAMQLAAYARGLSGTIIGIGEFSWPTCAIIFFDRDEPYSEMHVIKPADLERGWTMFRALLDYWKAANRYE